MSMDCEICGNRVNECECTEMMILVYNWQKEFDEIMKRDIPTDRAEDLAMFVESILETLDQK